MLLNSVEAVGAVGVPVKAGESIGAFSPIAVAVVVAKFASSPSAAASSSSVSSVVGAEATRFATSVRTNSVVAIWVVLVAAVAVGAVGMPVKAGEARSALSARSEEVTGATHSVS